MAENYDVVVVGGGAAGLSGAVALARSRRSVLVVDAGDPRNAPASHVHNFLTRDGIPPAATPPFAARLLCSITTDDHGVGQQNGACQRPVAAAADRGPPVSSRSARPQTQSQAPGCGRRPAGPG
jgi:choline dehydrogenase-like flavoprotein